VKIFLDSGNLKEIQKWLPFVDGVTTNPSILKKDGSSIEAVLGILPKDFPVSVEVGFPYEALARELGSRQGGPLVSVKIPLLNGDSTNNLDLIYRLSKSGISINCTALFSLGQVILGSKAGAKYVSLFGGRIDDEGGNSKDVIEQCSDYLYSSDSTAELIIGSIRTVTQVSDALVSGADIITLPPTILEKMLMHKYSVETSRQFQADWESSLKSK
jgi:transaldolase